MSEVRAARRVLIADDHRLFAEGLAALLKDKQYTTEIVTVLNEIVPMLDSFNPELLILDLAFRHDSAMPLLRQLRQERPELPILVISASEEIVMTERVRETGAAYLAKSRAGTDVVTMVEQLLTGKYVAPRGPSRPPLSPEGMVVGGVSLADRHIKVLRLLRLGHSNLEIATILGRAPKTVEANVSELYGRTGLNSRGRLIRWANQHSRALRGPVDGR